jgi:anti-anti-sigma regulatory factor
VTFMDSSGINVFVAAHPQTKDAQGVGTHRRGPASCPARTAGDRR